MTKPLVSAIRLLLMPREYHKECTSHLYIQSSRIADSFSDGKIDWCSSYASKSNQHTESCRDKLHNKQLGQRPLTHLGLDECQVNTNPHDRSGLGLAVEVQEPVASFCRTCAPLDIPELHDPPMSNNPLCPQTCSSGEGDPIDKPHLEDNRNEMGG